MYTKNLQRHTHIASTCVTALDTSIQNAKTHTQSHHTASSNSSSSRRGGGGVIGPYLCLEPQQSPRLLSAPPLSLSENMEEEDSDEACTPTPPPPPSTAAQASIIASIHTHSAPTRYKDGNEMSVPWVARVAELCNCGMAADNRHLIINLHTERWERNRDGEKRNERTREGTRVMEGMAGGRKREGAACSSSSCLRSH